MTPRWIILGSAGQLGTWLARRLRAAPGCELAAAADLPELDVSDGAAIERLIGGAARRGGPLFVVNAAAFTHVDDCESQPGEAERVNALAPGIVARACRAAGARLAHVSTDYVFDGEAATPRREDDPAEPRSVYGRTKLAGERAVLGCSQDFLVVRTSWLFGPGRNFVASVLGQAERARRDPGVRLRVVDDQVGAPTYAADLAAGLMRLLSDGRRGLYHLSNAGAATWWELAREALDRAGYADVAIERLRTADLGLPAPRPRYSLLDASRAARDGVVLRDWREALRDYLASQDAPVARPSGPREET